MNKNKPIKGLIFILWTNSLNVLDVNVYFSMKNHFLVVFLFIL